MALVDLKIALGISVTAAIDWLGIESDVQDSFSVRKCVRVGVHVRVRVRVCTLVNVRVCPDLFLSRSCTYAEFLPRLVFLVSSLIHT